MAKTIKLTGFVDSWGFARSNIEYQLQDIPEGEPVVLEVDSLGGDVGEAISISNLLHARGNVTAHIVGFCASAATWLVYGCDKVVINDDCAFLVHKCSTYIDEWGMMNADELDTLIEKLKSEKKSNEAIDLIIAQKYAKKAGDKLDVKGALKLMRENRWMVPDEALSLGLVDEISTEHKIQNQARRQFVMNSLHMPELPERLRTASDSEEKSFAQKVRDVLTDFFGGSVERLAPANAVKPEIPIITIMHNEYTHINALLNVEELEERDGGIMLTVDQLNQLNESLGLASQTEANLTQELNDSVARNDATIAAIDGISEAVASMETIEEKVNAIKDALNAAAGTTTHQQSEGDGHAEDFASDPVNAMVSIYRK